MAHDDASSKAKAALQYAKHAEKLSLVPNDAPIENREPTAAVQAKFITPQDPVIETSDGGRLPTVPLAEAVELNRLQQEAQSPGSTKGRQATFTDQNDEVTSLDGHRSQYSEQPDAPLSIADVPSRTNPLFPELPLYGPPSFTRNIQCLAFRASSAVLSLAFLGVIILGSAFTSIPLMIKNIGVRLSFRDPDARRPFFEEEKKRQKMRQGQNKAWKQKQRLGRSTTNARFGNEENGHYNEYEPTEGGRDPLICDAAYYARRVGLDIEEFKVQTEDGFILDLWHVYNPQEYTPTSVDHRDYMKPVASTTIDSESATSRTSTDSSKSYFRESYSMRFRSGKPGYPILMIHGLLQSSGAYCTNDDDSLAFFLCKRYILARDSLESANHTIVATMFGLAITDAASSLDINCLIMPTLECGLGTSVKWVSWIFLPSYRVYFWRQVSLASVSSAILKERHKHLSLWQRVKDLILATRSACSVPWHLLFMQDPSLEKCISSSCGSSRQACFE